MSADLEERIARIEADLADIKRQLTVLATGIALARWLGPFFVSVSAVLIVVVKG